MHRILSSMCGRKKSDPGPRDETPSFVPPPEVLRCTTWVDWWFYFSWQLFSGSPEVRALAIAEVESGEQDAGVMGQTAVVAAPRSHS